MSFSKKGIEESLNLPSSDELNKILGIQDEDMEEEQIPDLSLEEVQSSMIKLKEMRVQLKDIPDITSRKKFLDRLAEKAERAFDDIFDRAWNCEEKYASEMINAATQMLKIALDAHSKVIDSDVKLVDLQIKKDKIEIELNQKPKNDLIGASSSTDDDTIIMTSRNALLDNNKKNK